MPFTFNRIGTKYYGKRDLKEDGSFITTEWFVIIDIPIIPLGSFRVMPTRNRADLLFFKSKEYFVQRVSLNWRQVGNVYLVAIALLGALYGSVELLIWFYSRNNPSPAPQSQLTLPVTTEVSAERSLLGDLNPDFQTRDLLSFESFTHSA